MSTLILDRTRISLAHQAGALIVHEDGTRRGSIPIKLLDRIIIQSASLEWSSGTLMQLVAHGAAVLVLSPRQARQSALVLGPRHNDASIRLAQAELVADEQQRLIWAKRLISLKLKHQHRLLVELEQTRHDKRRGLRTGQQRLLRARAALPGTTAVASVRGLEGAAAAAYFSALGEVFPPSLGFTGRNRRPPRDPVNACLSLAYTLLHFDAVRAAHVAGLDPLLGFYHRPEFGRESLACDLVEPLRPRVDRFVWRLLADRIVREDSFRTDRGACLLGKAGRTRFYSVWESIAGPHRRLLRRQCQAVARAFRQRGEHRLAEWADLDEVDTADAFEN